MSRRPKWYTFTPNAERHIRRKDEYVLLGREKNCYQFWHCGSFLTLEEALSFYKLWSGHPDDEHFIMYNRRIIHGPGRELP